MQRKALFAVVLLGLALFPVSSGATALCASEGLSWLDSIVEAPDPQDAPPLDFARDGRNLKSTCTASCGTSTVSCTSSGSCTAVDRNCPTTPGYVVCGGTTKSCPACACTNGAKRYTQLSSCCYNEVVGQCRRTLREETCVNGNWQVTGFPCDGLNCSGSCPL
jgi:hypothetical protein